VNLDHLLDLVIEEFISEHCIFSNGDLQERDF
jgi:hypothetical protein